MIARLQRLLLASQVLLALAAMAWLIQRVGLHPVLAVPLGLLLPVGLHAAFLGGGFLLAAAAGGPRPAHAVGSLPVWVKAWAVEVLDSMRTFLFAQPLLAHRTWPQPPVPSRIPVLLVHGYFCNRAVWLPMASRLAEAGHPIAGIDLEPPFASIDTQAEALAQAVERLRQVTGAPRVALLGHSMGGLAARAFMRQHGDAAVAHVVTLGTPHRGTVLAWFGLGTCVREMRPDSDWLQALAASEPPARHRRFTLVRTWQDNIVAPHAIQALEGARMIDFGGIGHVTLAYDRHVQDTVLQVLASVDPVAEPA